MISIQCINSIADFHLCFCTNDCYTRRRRMVCFVRVDSVIHGEPRITIFCTFQHLLVCKNIINRNYHCRLWYFFTLWENVRLLHSSVQLVVNLMIVSTIPYHCSTHLDTNETRNSSGDETANVNFLYDDSAHVLQSTVPPPQTAQQGNSYSANTKISTGSQASNHWA